ncbi:hypothetical protein GGR50DRAFT_673201 [Xylaria sp. CBS 124048]|nr:hypothetical protein GGR50DRAFT_673201 [Xylaria sp. CBS 124048]
MSSSVSVPAWSILVCTYNLWASTTTTTTTTTILLLLLHNTTLNKLGRTSRSTLSAQVSDLSLVMSPLSRIPSPSPLPAPRSPSLKFAFNIITRHHHIYQPTKNIIHHTS